MLIPRLFQQVWCPTFGSRPSLLATKRGAGVFSRAACSTSFFGQRSRNDERVAAAISNLSWEPWHMHSPTPSAVEGHRPRSSFMWRPQGPNEIAAARGYGAGHRHRGRVFLLLRSWRLDELITIRTAERSSTPYDDPYVNGRAGNRGTLEMLRGCARPDIVLGPVLGRRPLSSWDRHRRQGSPIRRRRAVNRSRSRSVSHARCTKILNRARARSQSRPKVRAPTGLNDRTHAPNWRPSPSATELGVGGPCRHRDGP